MPITSKCIAVANYIIEETNKYNSDKTFREQVFMTNRRLQKILYLCNVVFMMLHNGEPLFEDSFFAWPSGPVIPSIYRIFIQFQDGRNYPRYDGKTLKLTDEEKTIIDNILKQTQKMDTIDLANIINIEGGPWKQFYNEYDTNNPNIIPNEDIYNFHLNRDTKIQIKDGPVLTKKLAPSKNIGNN